MVWEDFDGYGPIEPSIAGAIDFSHAARAEGRLDFIGAELCARG
jgi:hypothetical protein